MQGGKLLAAALQSNSRLTELDLTNNQIGPAAGAKVLAAVADEGGMRRTLRSLKMGGNLLGDHRAVRDALCDLVRISNAHWSKGMVTSHPPALRTLHLEHNNLGVRLAAPLSAALAESALTDLDLSWNLLRSAGIEVLALALQTSAHSSLQTLNLAWNGAGPKGGLALGAMLSGNSELTSLDLQHNNLDGVAAAVIAQVRHLVITPRAAAPIAQVLPCLYSLYDGCTCNGVYARYSYIYRGHTHHGYTCMAILAMAMRTAAMLTAAMLYSPGAAARQPHASRPRAVSQPLGAAGHWPGHG